MFAGLVRAAENARSAGNGNHWVGEIVNMYTMLRARTLHAGKLISSVPGCLLVTLIQSGCTDGTYSIGSRSTAKCWACPFTKDMPLYSWTQSAMLTEPLTLKTERRSTQPGFVSSLLTLFTTSTFIFNVDLFSADVEFSQAALNAGARCKPPYYL